MRRRQRLKKSQEKANRYRQQLLTKSVQSASQSCCHGIAGCQCSDGCMMRTRRLSHIHIDVTHGRHSSKDVGQISRQLDSAIVGCGSVTTKGGINKEYRVRENKYEWKSECYRMNSDEHLKTPSTCSVARSLEWRFEEEYDPRVDHYLVDDVCVSHGIKPWNFKRKLRWVLHGWRLKFLHVDLCEAAGLS